MKPAFPELPEPAGDRTGWPWEIEAASCSLQDVVLTEFPTVTLVTPSMNQGRFLEAAIRSVLLQGYPNLEYMVIDGGSEDVTRDILTRYDEHLAYWEISPDRGQSDAINKGWRRASGTYLWWLNADDMLAPLSLMETVGYLERHPEADLVYGHLDILDEDGNVRAKQLHRPFDLEAYIVDYRILPQPGALMRRDTLDSVGFLDDRLHYILDRDYYTRLALAGHRMDFHPRVLARLRVHPAAKTQTGSPRAVEERYTWLKRTLQHPATPDSVEERSQSAWSKVHLVNARIFMKYGDYRATMGAIWRSLKASPRGLLRSELWVNLTLALMGLTLGRRRTEQVRGIVRCLRAALR
jgi:glycosyltransferase involved in cell wall biosynthesis